MLDSSADSISRDPTSPVAVPEYVTSGFEKYRMRSQSAGNPLNEHST